MNYVNENAADISAFLTEWDETLCAKTIQSDETTGVRIFSIHKSKGLEYEHVIIPFCDWQLEKQSGNILWCQPSEAPFNDLPIVPVDYSQKQMMGTIFEADYRHEHLQNTVDNLNLLYVAFTRARSSLFVIGRRKASGTRSLLIEQSLPLLTDALRESDPNADILLEGLDDDTATLRLTYGSLSYHKIQSSWQSQAAKPSAKLKVTSIVIISSMAVLTTRRIMINTISSPTAMKTVTISLAMPIPSWTIAASASCF